MKAIPHMAENLFDLVITDPPYGMEFRSNHRKIKYDKIENDSSTEWIPDLLAGLYRVMKNDSHLYMFCSFHNVDEFLSSAKKHFKIKNILIWEKNNTGMGDLTGSYAPKYEMILFASKGRKILNGGRDPDILRYSRTGNKFHPTEKPVDLLEYLIGKSSTKGDIVFDPFAGSGSTGVACVNTGRSFIGIEVKENYCITARERIENARIEQGL